MKKILGLDLGTASIGWALVKESEKKEENSEIIKLGVRVNPLTVDEQKNFEQGKSITTNAERTLKRSARRNLQRYKLRRDNLLSILRNNNFINKDTILSENGNASTFETYRLRAKAVDEKISLEEFSRVLFMLNKKRGYKSSRKVKSTEDGALIDGMDIAKILYNDKITPAQYVLPFLINGKKGVPEFYSSDLKNEFDKIWTYQSQFYPEILTEEFKQQIQGKAKTKTNKIFYAKYGINTAEIKIKNKKLQQYQWRVDALSNQLSKEELSYVISDLNGILSGLSGYLGDISDRSKEIYFSNKTVGQYLMDIISQSSSFTLKNRVFYRRDYLDEFNIIWDCQAKFHPELTEELKNEIRDVIIFYQRNLKSQKGLISTCELEGKEILKGDKKIKIGAKVCPKSSPIFQEFKIWQILNNLEIKNKNNSEKYVLELEHKKLLFNELTLKSSLSSSKVLSLLLDKPKDYELNYKNIEGNKTQESLFLAYQKIIELSGHGEYNFSKMNSIDIYDIVERVFGGLGFNTEILHFDSDKEGKDFENQASYQLWHLLYSYEGDNSDTGNEALINKISELYGFDKEYAKIISGVVFQPDYGSLSTKAIRKILPHMKEGNEYSLACHLAGYNHSKSSLTKEELDNKKLVDKLEILPKNSLRNPVVEKILNQMINVVNSVTETYGKPDEIRIELARELKKSASDREKDTKAIASATKNNQKVRETIQKEFGIANPSRNDIIRYKLYEELENNGYKTLYSNIYIPKDKIFSKDIDIEHIIPQAKLFDDSFSNKTLEYRSVNLEKADATAYDYVASKYGEEGVFKYLERIKSLCSDKSISKSKYNKLKMKLKDIPEGFINRELKDSQYIAKKAKEILHDIVRTVTSTTGSITDRLREDWQLIDVMKELNWDKYEKLGLTTIIYNKENQPIRRIIDWTKRNDHRHHAMDALTIAFTKPSYIQYLNNLNARTDKSRGIYGIQNKEMYRDANKNLKFIPPMPLDEFRAEAKKELENILVSIKAKNKVVTKNINKIKVKGSIIKKEELTPRGQLHKETIYGKINQYDTKMEKVGASFDEEKISTVAKKCYREALLKRLREFDNNAKKAFTAKNNLEKNPIFIDEQHSSTVPKVVKTVSLKPLYTVRKPITKDLNIEKVIDVKIKHILEQRLAEYGGDKGKAFDNLDDNPIWLDKKYGIKIKSVKIGETIKNAVALHSKKDKNGKLVFDENGDKQSIDFVNPGNNHHVAIYQDEKGKLQEHVVSFFEATERARNKYSIIDKEFNNSLGWKFMFSMKQNEYFVFPNEETGFNPKEIDLMNSENYALISPNLYRVQKISSKNYWFRHHLETSINDSKKTAGITYKNIRSTDYLKDIVKIRVNHIGQIVSIGEY